MTEISTVQIIQPTKTGQARSAEPRTGGTEVRDLVVAGTFVHGPMFSHAGAANGGSGPMVSAPFLAQHLHQEVARHDVAADTRIVAQAYARPLAVSAPHGEFALSA